jgi:rhodanese-related sulfurtransferase
MNRTMIIALVIGALLIFAYWRKEKLASTVMKPAPVAVAPTVVTVPATKTATPAVAATPAKSAAQMSAEAQARRICAYVQKSGQYILPAIYMRRLITGGVTKIAVPRSHFDCFREGGTRDISFFKYYSPVFIPYEYRLTASFQIGPIHAVKDLDAVIATPGLLSSLKMSAGQLRAEIMDTYGVWGINDTYLILDLSSRSLAWKRDRFGAPKVSAIAKILNSKRDLQSFPSSGLIVDLQPPEKNTSLGLKNVVKIPVNLPSITNYLFRNPDSILPYVKDTVALGKLPKDKPLLLVAGSESSLAAYAMAYYLTNIGHLNLSIYRLGYEDWVQPEVRQAYREIPYASIITAHEILQKPREPRLFLDARKVEEFAKIHILGAMRISPNVSVGDKQNLRPRLQKAQRYFGVRQIVIYGVNEFDPRPASVAQNLKELGATRVYWLRGGIQEMDLASEVEPMASLREFRSVNDFEKVKAANTSQDPWRSNQVLNYISKRSVFAGSDLERTALAAAQ